MKPKVRRIKRKHRNPMDHVPAAACPRCGGWTGHGGMAQHSHAKKPVLGRTGCACHR
jgi:hypothetical protein